MFRVTKEIDFCYGHRLLNYDGKCKFLHGHNGRAVITIESETVDNRGMVVDFSDIKRVVSRWIDDNLDHRMILHANDPAVAVLRELSEPLYLIGENPTAENIAKLIFDYAAGEEFPVVEVSLWETPRSYATYRRKLPAQYFVWRGFSGARNKKARHRFMEPTPDYVPPGMIYSHRRMPLASNAGEHARGSFFKLRQEHHCCRCFTMPLTGNLIGLTCQRTLAIFAECAGRAGSSPHAGVPD